MRQTDFETRGRIQELLTKEAGIPMQKSAKLAIMIGDLLYVEEPEAPWRVKEEEVNWPENSGSPTLPGLERALNRTIYRIALIQVLLLLGIVLWLSWNA